MHRSTDRFDARRRSPVSDGAEEAASVHAAVEEVLHSGQQFMADRLELFQLDLRDQVGRTLMDLSAGAVAAVAGLLALGTLTVAATLGLSRLMPLDAAALCVALGQLAIGAAAAGFVVARRRRQMVGRPSATGDGTSFSPREVPIR